MTLETLVANHLADWQAGWSMGGFGAIAEFHQDKAEPAVVDAPATLARATRRGGIRFDRRQLGAATAVAYEMLSPKRHRWSHAVAFCLPAKAARMHERSVLTELGPDDDALRGIDGTGILFDMGLAVPQCDFCIRTSDPKLLKALRANIGLSLFDPASTAMGAILAGHPHRVALTRLGRAEVYQKIGGPDTGGVSPPGPHTHVLPKLLRTGKTHSSNTPIPLGLVPVASFHPGNPVVGAMGEERDFDAVLHDAFQNLLARFGAPETVAEKQRVIAAMAEASSPSDFELPASRPGRVAVRLALRQQERIAEAAGDAQMLERLAAWRAVIEPNRDEIDEEDDAPGH